MTNLRKQIMDFKWLLERGSDILNINQLNKFHNIKNV